MLIDIKTSILIETSDKSEGTIKGQHRKCSKPGWHFIVGNQQLHTPVYHVASNHP